MTPDPAGIQDSRTAGRAAPGWGGGDAPHGTVGWYWDASGGFIPGTPDTWNPQVAFLVFPRITSSPRIERRATSRFAALSHHISTLPVADQVRELQTALSVNKSELARILRVSRPTVYDWLDGGQPNAGNRARIRTLLRLLWESGVRPANPLFPRFVRSGLEPGGRPLLDVLVEERVDEAAVRRAVGRVKGLGDAIALAQSQVDTPTEEAPAEQDCRQSALRTDYEACP